MGQKLEPEICIQEAVRLMTAALQLLDDADQEIAACRLSAVIEALGDQESSMSLFEMGPPAIDRYIATSSETETDYLAEE